MKLTTIVATAVMLFGLASNAAAQSLASASAPEPLTGLVLGVGLLALGFLRRR